MSIGLPISAFFLIGGLSQGRSMFSWMHRSIVVLCSLITCAVPALVCAESNPDTPDIEAKTIPTNEPVELRVLDNREINAQNTVIRDIESPKLSDAQLKGVKNQIDAILRQKALAHTNTAVYVVDLETGQTVYAKQASTPLKPASNMKLVTTAAAMGILGPSYRFETKVYADGEILKDGTLKGDLHMHIDHDFTWSDRFYETGDVPMQNLILQIKDAGIKKITGKVIVSGNVVYGGKSTNVLNPSFYMTKTARQFGNLLRNARLTTQPASAQSNTKPKGKVIATWYSPTLSEACVPLNRVSHNEYADMLLMAIGQKVEGKNTFEAGAKAEKAWLKKIGLDSKDIVIKDGSGLSHDNRVTAQFLVKLTEYMLHSEYATPWAASLSISGYDGTYGGRLQGADTRGRVLVKSGTLHDVISGSGFFVNKYDGRVYGFSILVNSMRQKKATRIAIDQIVRAFAGNLHNWERPETPGMISLRRENDAVIARWSAVKNAAGYHLWKSYDGQTWQKDNRIYSIQTLASLPTEDKPFSVRVSAVSADGAESDPSIAFGYAPGDKKLTVVEAASCRWEEHTRPVNRFFSHERAIMAAIPDGYGMETIIPSEIPEHTDSIFWHGGVCGSTLQNNDDILQKIWNKGIPVIVDNFERHATTAPEGATCNPAEGLFQGRFGAPVVGKDRRVGELRQNRRLRKASGTGNGRPTTIIPWEGAKGCMNIGKLASVAACSPGHAILGVDIQAFDSKETQQAVWKLIQNGIQ